jgi:hypothetical protein
MKKPSPARVAAFALLGLALVQGSLAETIQTAQANLRSGPDKLSRVVTALPKGTRVSIIQTQGNYALVRVDRSGISGWIYTPAQGWPAAPPQATQAMAPAPATAAAEPIPQAAPAQAAPAQAEVAPAMTYDLGGGTPVAASELRLSMDPRDAEVLFLKDPFDKSAFPVRLQGSNGEAEGEIAVKGSFSRRYLKKSLLITLPKDKPWQGRRRIALNAMATDPAQSREWLAWNLAHKLGMMIPQVGYQRLYVNGKYIGLYLDIEWMDEAMFGGYGHAGGELYQPDDSSFCGDFSPANQARIKDCWTQAFPRGGDMARLRALGKALGETPAEQFDAWLDANFDAQSVIDWLLVNTLTQNGDTYNKNYFLHYSTRDNKWRVIPWDYDLSWGRVADNAQPFPMSIHNRHFQYLYPPVIGAENPLKFKTLKNPRLYARFLSRLKEVSSPGSTPAAGWFMPGQFQRQLADIKALVEPSKRQEAYPAPQQGATSTHFDALAFFNEWRYHTLKALLLEASPFDTPRWLPYTSYDPITPVTPESLKQRRRQTLDLVSSATLATPGEKTVFTEQLLAYPLAMVTLKQAEVPTRLSVETVREAVPDALPPGRKPAQCIERTWFVSVKSAQPASVDLQIDYLDESSTRHELGSAIQDEDKLALWRHDGSAWQKTGARHNAIANYFVASDQALKPGAVNRYVACEE